MKKEDFDDYTREELLSLFVDTLNNMKSDGDCYDNVYNSLLKNSISKDFYHGYSNGLLKYVNTVTTKLRTRDKYDWSVCPCCNSVEYLSQNGARGRTGPINPNDPPYPPWGYLCKKCNVSFYSFATIPTNDPPVYGAPNGYRSQENLAEELFEKLSQPLSKEQQEIMYEVNEIVSNNFWKLD